MAAMQQTTAVGGGKSSSTSTSGGGGVGSGSANNNSAATNQMLEIQRQATEHLQRQYLLDMIPPGSLAQNWSSKKWLCWLTAVQAEIRQSRTQILLRSCSFKREGGRWGVHVCVCLPESPSLLQEQYWSKMCVLLCLTPHGLLLVDWREELLMKCMLMTGIWPYCFIRMDISHRSLIVSNWNSMYNLSILLHGPQFCNIT